jgi:alkylation response protein AidB-like acyl-CoA dehydrogenase
VTYQAPLDDLVFVLRHVVGLPDLDLGIDMDEVEQVLREAGRFAGEVLAPLNRVGDLEPPLLDNGVVRTSPGFADAYRRFVAGGWNAVSGDPEHGGNGLPDMLASALTELWNGANAAFALCPLLTQSAAATLARYGSERQKSLYLPHLVAGDWTGPMCLTEPQAGSDLGAIRTTARPDGEYFRLTGGKIFITWGEHDMAENLVHMVLGRIAGAADGSAGLSLFLVPKHRVGEDGVLGGANAVRCLRLEHKLGLHASPTAEITYDGAHAELVGAPHRGLATMFSMMNQARLAIGVQGVGLAERAYQQARDYARLRVQGRPVGLATDESLPILHHPDVRRMLMLARSRLEAARALALEAAAMSDRVRLGEEGAPARLDLLIPLVKAYATDGAVEIASTAIQIHGGAGFIEETGIAQCYRDARVMPIYEGTNGIQAADLVARKLVRDGGAAMTALLRDINRTHADLTERAAAELRVLAPALRTGRAALERASTWLIATYPGDPRRVLAAASPYLRLAAIVTCGWLMARAALAAHAELAAARGDARFLRAKLITARCFAEHVLVEAEMLESVIRNGGTSLLALDAESF